MFASGPRRGDAKERLLARAVRVIEEQGEVALRVNDIAKDCDIAITSLYHYFGSRDGLIGAAQAHRYETLAGEDLAGFEVALQRCTSRDEFLELVRGSLGYFYAAPERVHARRARMEILGAAVHRPALAEAVARAQASFNDRLASVLKMPQERGWIRADVDLRAFAAFYLGLLSSRALIEIGETGVDQGAWNALATAALTSIVS